MRPLLAPALSGLFGVLVGAGLVWYRERAMEQARIEAVKQYAKALWDTPVVGSPMVGKVSGDWP